ncbi:MAG: tetratricopeptide repeat protein [Flavobacteriales bacterium]|nr:tetratricopeptide repeat protein [Flavobacteriales bacterium]MCB9190405.1 tetratricopeptide repeat protein [Flavobacteriales bacterium]MCB9204654.1 tetratricopeptide repeat protein [Flavobacteriales bacterium]
MRPLLLLLFLLSTGICVAQDAEPASQESTAGMTKEEKIAAARAKARAEGDTAAVAAPSMTPYEEAAKSYNLANDLKEQRKYDEAQAEFDKAIEIDPNFVEAYVGRGGIKFQKIEFPAAMEDYNRAVEIAENLVEMHEYKASIKNVLADYEGSKIEGSKADAMKNRLAEALYHRGHLKRFMEDKGGGCTDLRKALDLGYGRAKTDWPDLCQ